MLCSLAVCIAVCSELLGSTLLYPMSVPYSGYMKVHLFLPYVCDIETLQSYWLQLLHNILTCVSGVLTEPSWCTPNWRVR